MTKTLNLSSILLTQSQIVVWYSKQQYFQPVMLQKDPISSLSGWVFSCTVISQGQHANFQPPQPPEPSGQKCENLRERNICALWLLSSRQTSPNAFMLCKGHCTASSTSAVWLRGVECHWLSSAALRLPSQSLNLS